MSKYCFDIKFVTLGQLFSEMSQLVSIIPLFFHNFSLMYNGFIKIHEYSNKIVFISVHKVRELCLSITLRSSLLL